MVATVTLAPCPAGVVPASCSTTSRASDGYWLFTGVPDGAYTVSYAMADPLAVAPAPDPVTVAGGAGPGSLFRVVQFNNTVQFAGNLMDNHGGTVASQSIVLHDVSGATPDVNTASDAAGHFSARLLKNTSYNVLFNNTNNAAALHAPARYDLTTTSPLVVGTTDITLDLNLPEVRVPVCVTDTSAAPNPVRNALVETDQSTTLGLNIAPGLPVQGSDWYNQGYPTTDATGCTVLWLFPNPRQHIMTITPQASSGLATMSFAVPVDTSTDGITVSLRLNSAVTLSGTVTDSAGGPLAGQVVEVQATISSSAPWAGTTTDSSGAFAIPGLVLNAAYNLRLSSPNVAPATPYNGPSHYTLATSTPITATAAPLTLALPEVAVPVTVTVNHSMRLAGVQVTAPGLETITSGSALAGQPVTGTDLVDQPYWAPTGSTGVSTLWLFPSATPYQLFATPAFPDRPCSSGAVSTALLVASGAAASLDLTCAVNFAGTVLDGAGNPAGGQTVTVTDSLADPFAGATSAMAARLGSFLIQVPGPDTYSVAVSGGGDGTQALPPAYTAAFPSGALAADVRGLALRVPFVPLAVTVTDAGGAPLAGAALTPLSGASGGSSFDYGSAPPATGSGGQATLWVLPGTYTVTATSGALSATKPVTVGAAGGSLAFALGAAPPPDVTATLSPAPNPAGWNRGPVTVTWNTGGGTPAPGSCSTVTLSAQTAGTVLSCTASTSGGSATRSVTVKIDLTPPALTWTPDGGTYTVDATVAMTCTATDALSGPASQGCGSVSGDAYSFPLGLNTVHGSATDAAGNTGTRDGHFTVIVTAASECALVRRWESSRTFRHVLCSLLGVRQGEEGEGTDRELETGDGSGSAKVKLRAFTVIVRAQEGKTISTEHGEVLIRLAGSLLSASPGSGRDDHPVEVGEKGPTLVGVAGRRVED